MVAVTLNISEPLYAHICEAAKAEAISVNQFTILALEEKIAALQTIDYLETRAKRGSREKLLEILAKAPDVEPEEYDRLE